jgi:hypothetical protein
MDLKTPLRFRVSSFACKAIIELQRYPSFARRQLNPTDKTFTKTDSDSTRTKSRRIALRLDFTRRRFAFTASERTSQTSDCLRNDKTERDKDESGDDCKIPQRSAKRAGRLTQQQDATTERRQIGNERALKKTKDEKEKVATTTICKMDLKRLSGFYSMPNGLR